MKTAVLTLLFSGISLCVVAGPPTLEVDSRIVSVAGRYRYQPLNRPSLRGTLELRLDFAPRPEASKVAPTFGDTDYIVTTVSFTLDGKPQKFPTELLRSLGYCSPDSIFLWSDGSAAGVLMTIDFSSGANKTLLAFRIRDNAISPEEKPKEPK